MMTLPNTRVSRVRRRWSRMRSCALDRVGRLPIVAARANVRDAGRATFVQADCFNPALPTEFFDFALSIGVAQHTPDPLRFVRSVARMVRPGGRAAFWVYERGLTRRLRPKYLLRPLTRRLSSRSNQVLTGWLCDAFLPSSPWHVSPDLVPGRRGRCVGL